MTRRYPLDALVAAAGLSENALGRKVGLSGSTLKRARTDGLSADAADRYAIRAGLHPYEVWPEMIEHQIANASAACAECGGQFIPTRKGHRFCNPSCARRARDRDWQRNRYNTDDELRQRRLAQKRRYHQEAARAIAAKSKRWRAANAEHKRQSDQAWREANRERIRKARRAYYEANREREITRQRAYDQRIRAARRTTEENAA